jgi:hypothetical protein
LSFPKLGEAGEEIWTETSDRVRRKSAAVTGGVRVIVISENASMGGDRGKQCFKPELAVISLPSLVGMAVKSVDGENTGMRLLVR